MPTRAILPLIISHDCNADVGSSRFIAPRERIAALADDGAFTEHDRLLPSPHLARYGIVPQDDDGVVTASLRIGGRDFEAVAQDARFLRGSVGDQHGRKIAAAIERARSGRRPLLVLAASGGARLHEANAAEIAFARALRALVDAREGGLIALAIGTGDVFGGMSVLAGACNALALLPPARLGLSGPQVIALTGGGGIDAADRVAVDAIFGASARVRAGLADSVDDDAGEVREWIARQLANALPFARWVSANQLRLRAESGYATTRVVLQVKGAHATLPAFAGEVGAAALIDADAQLLALPAEVSCILIVEDSRGHERSAGAEILGLWRYFAQHACVLGLLRARGVNIVGVIDGTGHSAAFFTNALQADRLYALPHGRVLAMEPQALAHVTGIDAARVAQAIENDPLLGHPVRHFAALGGLTQIASIDEVR